MKTIVIANHEPHLNAALHNSTQIDVLRTVTFTDGLIPVLKELQPDVIVFSPTLTGSEPIAPEDVLFEISMMEPMPQVILLAGYVEHIDDFLIEAIHHGVYDIVISTATERVWEEHLEQVLERIANPRTRVQVYAELGITRRKPLAAKSAVPEEQVERLAHQAIDSGDDAPAVAPPVIVPPVLAPPKQQKPYVVGVFSPASAGASFVAINVAATMATDGFKTALIDFDAKRTLHHWLGRSADNASFAHLFEQEAIVDEETPIYNLDAFTSMNLEGQGDLRWLTTIETMPYEIVVLDFSSGQAWQKESLLQALHACDEIQFVLDLDYAKAMQSRQLLEELASTTTTTLRVVLNKWSEEYQPPCDVSDFAPIPATYRIPLCHDVYRAIVYGKPLVALLPELQTHFGLKDFQIRGVVG